MKLIIQEFIKNRFNMREIKDLTGQKFNRLTVIGLGERNSCGKIQWKCKCDCGKIVFATTTYLKNGHTKSCGCLNREKASNRLKNNNFIKSREKNIKEKFLKEGTNLALIKNTEKLRKNNTSGCTGVTYNNNNKNWRASIFFKGKKINLGSFKNIEDAIKTRKKAEEKYFKPTLEKYNNE